MRTTLLILVLMVFLAGCLETKEAWPAVVSDSVLKEKGWAGGDVQKQSQSQNVAGVTIKINMAIMNYRDEPLARNITQQVQKLTGLSREQAQGASQFTSQLLTVRLVLPAGVSLPSEIVDRIIGSQFEQIASQNNIRDFNETVPTKTTLAGGKEISIKNYEGHIDFEGGSIKIRAMIASWPDAGSTIIVFGVMPVEDIVIAQKQGKPLVVKINGDRESQKIITLIQNVK